VVFSQAKLRATSGDRLVLLVGGGGGTVLNSAGGAGGVGGGGEGGSGEWGGGGGGGASTLRRLDPSSALASAREGELLLVAAGGAGGGSTDYCCAHGGAGGGRSGSSPPANQGVPQSETAQRLHGSGHGTPVSNSFAPNGFGARHEYTPPDCAAGQSAGGSAGCVASSLDLEGLPARHRHADWGAAPLADYSTLAAAGKGATLVGGGEAGKSASFEVQSFAFPSSSFF